MRSVTVSTTVDRPVDDVFDFLVDSRNDPRWCPMAHSYELVEGEPGQGALYRYQQRQGPGMPHLTVEMRTTVAERPHRLEWRGEGRGPDYHAIIELREEAGRTHVRHTNRVRVGNPVQQVLWFSIANTVLRVQLRNLARELSR